ncbi:uncharacterized protein LOC124292203 [Haliotis rubra]|uniref:uncharacterized protein LOC124292203 n=1 Tax=Haliotis rubra TaxID=36100 RepID=UPI001EE61783|nr:uncharacterized protein LOC124292203 [Haliotis rubra]
MDGEKRLRTMTERGEQMYETIRDRHLSKIDESWNSLGLQINCDVDILSLRREERDLMKRTDYFYTLCTAYQMFLERNNTSMSRNDLQDFLLDFDERRDFIEEARTTVDNAIQKQLETVSDQVKKEQMSVAGSKRSGGSSTSVRLKAEAAKLELEFAVKESLVKKKQALLEEEERIRLARVTRQKKDLETELDVLRREKVVVSAMANMEADAELVGLPQQDSIERTQQYVERCANLEATDDARGQQTRPPIDPTAGFSKYMLRRDLQMSRLRSYDDRPETYNCWKSNFKDVLRDLDVTAAEEMDLLIRWLGPESGKQAQGIRVSCTADPVLGLQKIWDRLDERYGSPELIEINLRKRLGSFPKLTLRDNDKLYELADLLSEIECLKLCDKYRSLLAYFDSAVGVLPIVSKLPFSFQEKWRSTAFKYKEDHRVPFPPFSFFVNFIKELSRIRNDPSFFVEQANLKEEKPSYDQNKSRPRVASKKVEVTSRYDTMKPVCPFHNTNHPLNQCRAFSTKTYKERKDFLKKHGYCYRCCMNNKHLARNCREEIKCGICGTSKHPTFLHFEYSSAQSEDRTLQENGGEKQKDQVISKCSQICGKTFGGKSCSKTVLVRVYHKDKPELSVKVYAILDDQSNVTLARPELFDLLKVDTDDIQYTISSCTGTSDTYGRRASNLVVESFDRSHTLDVPHVIECPQVPDMREEIPTPEIVLSYPHLQDVQIPQLDNDAQILLLIGRDVIEAHHVLDQKIGPKGSPYAQLLALGWVVIGETCLGKVHRPNHVTVNKIYISRTGQDHRGSVFHPCPNNLYVEKVSSIFEVTKDDNKQGKSMEDIDFLQIMDNEMTMGPEGFWTAPLPFKPERRRLPGNKSQAFHRAYSLDRSLQKDPIKRAHFVDFMKKIFDSNHAELAPPLEDGEEHWYLPIFGVYHPKKPDQIRAVFDSSAVCDGISLNNVLLQGPDLMNSLLGVLLRFRKEEVAAMADIQSMFHCFQVKKEHRNFLRFFWYEDNDPSKRLTEYRMRVHVFGNKPSPSIATYGLKKAATQGQDIYGLDTKTFIENEFYVDDGLTSCPTPEETVDLLKRTQKSLQENGNLRLHKVVSNSSVVMKAFPQEDLAKNLMNLDLRTDSFPLQRSLGMLWNINTDTFTFRSSREMKPCTRRGVLSTVHSIFDPLGFIAPIVIQGKQILQDIARDKYDWDDQLDLGKVSEFKKWRDSLILLEDVNISRMFVPSSFRHSVKKEIHIFADASEKSIAASAYLRTVDKNGVSHNGFILGKAKVVPSHAHTIPRLELCAAVLAADVADCVSRHLNLPLDSVHYYTDSKIVLGYIRNTSKRFTIYVSNRIQKIRRISMPDQWIYIPSDMNPADVATRPVSMTNFGENKWLKGVPHFLDRTGKMQLQEDQSEFEEVVTAVATKVHVGQSLRSERFERFSDWKSLVRAISFLKMFIATRKPDSFKLTPTDVFRNAEIFIIQEVQMEHFRTEIDCVRSGSRIPSNSTILSLNPYLNEDGLLCVGGRLRYSQIDVKQKTPVIIPKGHVAVLLVRHYHAEVRHQGRHFTEGAVRAAGYWVLGGKRLISSTIHKCVKCRKMRKRPATQLMADLPSDRLTPSPPFTFTGVDTFGPWTVAS